MENEMEAGGKKGNDQILQVNRSAGAKPLQDLERSPDKISISQFLNVTARRCHRCRPGDR